MIDLPNKKLSNTITLPPFSQQFTHIQVHKQLRYILGLLSIGNSLPIPESSNSQLSLSQSLHLNLMRINLLFLDS